MVSPSQFPLAAELSGETEEETKLLSSMAVEARRYLESQRWCSAVTELRYAAGVGRVVAAFLARPEYVEEHVGDDWLWVIVGDMPSAYLVTDEAPDAAEALLIYSELMEDWARTVMDGGDLADVFPVAAEPSAANAEALLGRLKFVRESVIPWIRDSP